jgi:toxin ParE1/3/4
MSRYTVTLDRDAEQDLEEIVAYIADHDSVARAIAVADNIERQVEALAAFPHRGAFPRELLEYDIRDFREAIFGPYRIIYRVVKRDVVIVLIADGRRDMRALLARRLLGA